MVGNGERGRLYMVVRAMEADGEVRVMVKSLYMVGKGIVTVNGESQELIWE